MNKQKKQNFQKYNSIFPWYTELLTLIFKSYRRSFSNIFFGFIQPIILFAVFYFIFTGLENSKPSEVVPGYILLAAISTCLNGLSNMLSIWKDSILLKRLNITSLSKKSILSMLLLFFSLVSILAIIWMFLWSLFFIAVQKGTSQVDTLLANINWGYLILSCLLLIITCSSMAILISGLVVGQNKTQAFISMFFFPSAFLGGIIIPLSKLNNTSEGMKWFTCFIPFKYSVIFSNMAWNNGALPTNSIFNNHLIWLVALIGFIIPILIMLCSFKTFNWTNKK